MKHPLAPQHWHDLIIWYEQGVPLAEQSRRLGRGRRSIERYREQLAAQGRIVLGDYHEDDDTFSASVLPLDEDRPAVIYHPYVCGLCGMLYRVHLQCNSCSKFLGANHADGDGIVRNGLRYCDAACATKHVRGRAA